MWTVDAQGQHFKSIVIFTPSLKTQIEVGGRWALGLRTARTCLAEYMEPLARQGES